MLAAVINDRSCASIRTCSATGIPGGCTLPLPMLLWSCLTFDVSNERIVTQQDFMVMGRKRGTCKCISQLRSDAIELGVLGPHVYPFSHGKMPRW